MNASLMMSGWGRKLGARLMKARLKPRKPEPECAWRIVRGDNVQVINGRQTGQKGKVLTVLRKSNRVIVDGVNLRSRNIKKQADGTPGKKIMKPCAIHYSNIMVIDPATNEPTKTSVRFLEDGTKVRVNRKTGSLIPKPEPLLDKKPRSNVVGPKDTAPEEVFKVSFNAYEKYLPFLYPHGEKYRV
mmetsp:Transcript_63186/g.124450  ORF Transcript_63186/g.124450 Transcript_63186/m.124450 type:complete len:186 (+) Transcript_63186:83-640(+)|eukprot:CAMPEP_0170390408 /NCGR_PEP_ID=MMETSP0117_2-20130122/19130_1 /TAXON_ID=400756 /ORGANISM="Durinskia baltica, Strain CSIRO CS-38" /LENGTH=185 /DNA_ID=CAMNT_0010646451 /DNA_START=83 /DNA_END=640 /DNA_ORIENTATION=+